MKKTNIFALAAVTTSVVLTTNSSAGIQGLEMNLVNTGAQGDTYRLFVNMDAGARVDAIYGNSVSTLKIGLNAGTFYQNANGGHSSKQINSNFFPFVPSMEWDSYVTIGAYYQNGAPFGENNLNDIGIDWSGFESGGDLITDNGSWFVTPDDVQGNELNGQVFIGQFTVQGGTNSIEDFDISVNIQGKDADGNTINANGVTLAIPSPGALALLGMAGFVSRRRRK